MDFFQVERLKKGGWDWGLGDWGIGGLGIRGLGIRRLED